VAAPTAESSMCSIVAASETPSKFCSRSDGPSSAAGEEDVTTGVTDDIVAI